jgi:lipopolysaccharide transport system permease protein
MREWMEYKIGRNKSFSLVVRELWVRRELFFIFAWRDLKLKYRQTIIGFAWVVLQPLVMMAIFTIVFASRIDTSATEIPYPVFVFAGLIIYNAFSGGVSTGSNSLVIHAHIIKKNYFPRIILPASSVIISFIDFLASLVILLILMVFLTDELHLFHFMVYSLAAFVMTIIPILGFGILFSGLNVRYRDVNFIFPFFLQIMLFISPIIYPIHTVTNSVFKAILIFNPISAAIEIQKLAVQINYSPDMSIVLASLGASVIVFIVGIFTFNKLEKNFADII